MSLFEKLKKAVPYVVNPKEDSSLLYDFLYKEKNELPSVIVDAIIEEQKPRAEPPKNRKIVEEVKEEKKYQWCFINNGRYAPFDCILNRQIEEAVNNEISEYRYVFNEVEFSLDLKKLLCINSVTKDAMKIERVVSDYKALNVPEQEEKKEDKKAAPAFADNKESPESLIADIMLSYQAAAAQPRQPADLEYDGPPEWKPCIKKRLPEDSPRFKDVKKLFDATMKNQYKYIIVEELHNNRVRYYYQRKLLQMLLERNVSENDLTLGLFHGTSKTEPKTIYNGFDATFDPKYARGGIWGTGTYFAVKAAYSANYAYVKGKVSQMFLADVIIGNYYDFGQVGNNGLIYPPEVKQGEGKRFDSVKAFTNGSHIYVVYDANTAYPTYLISYSNSPILSAN